MLKIVDSIGRYIVKKVELNKFVKGRRVQVYQIPLLAYKMNRMIEIVDRLMDSKFRSMCKEMESNLGGVRKVFKKEYFQGPLKPVRYLLTIADVEAQQKDIILYYFKSKLFGKIMCFKAYFSFRCLKKSYYFELDSPGKYETSKTLGRAESMCELVNNDFQNRFRDKLEKFEEIYCSEYKNFKFRTGDCLLLPRVPLTVGPLYYHHVLFLGCPDSCKSSIKCTCLNIFHFTNDQIDLNLVTDSSKSVEKAGFEYFNINEYLNSNEFLKVKRNQFIRLTKSQYYEKAAEYKKKLENKLKGEKNNSESYNLLFNNCGHVVNSFENPVPDMGPDNRFRMQLAFMFGGTIGVFGMIKSRVASSMSVVSSRTSSASSSSAASRSSS